jgi:hypothetical protein
VDEHPVPESRPYFAPPERTVAIVAHVTPLVGTQDEGALLLFDPAGRNIQAVAQQVREIQGVAVDSDEIAVMYQRQGRYVMARFRRSTLAKITETQVSFPVLK